MKISTRLRLPLGAIALLLIASPMGAQTGSPLQNGTAVRLIINSNQDSIRPDEGLTLREALSLLNGTLSRDDLTAAEQAQVQSGEGGPRIEFDLPPGQTTIELDSALPELMVPGLIVDGTTQAGYDPDRSATAEIEIPIPVVGLTPALNTEVLRGLTITASDITIRGLSLYGFTSRHGLTATTPPADIFIAPQNLPADRVRESSVDVNRLRGDREPPQNVVIENNWLGLPPQLPENGDRPAIATPRSAFGVVAFNAVAPIIRQNRIENHDGSAIITGVRAEGMQVTNNILVGNGVAGMPDAIRLEGSIDATVISGNLICGTDGSGVYLFKPEGSVEIRDNQLSYNSRRLRRAVIYVMGSDHQIQNNEIRNQPGPGVVVAAYPTSHRNLIQGNRFAALDGLSIDLVTQDNVSVRDFQVGDGPNPPRRSANRRNDTANRAINAPRLTLGDDNGAEVMVLGQADPGSIVELYRVTNFDSAYGELAEQMQTVTPDETGAFTAQVPLEPGLGVSAIATDPRYGTSEPSPTLLIGAPTTAPPPPGEIPRCTTAPVPPAPEPEPVPEPEPQPILVPLQVPTNVHFALDQATLSSDSQAVLDRVVEVLLEYPQITVELQGHTDPRGTAAYNLDLSNRRALAVRNYLLAQGIAPERMRIVAFGREQRRTQGNTRLDYARDRRVELIFSDSRGFDLLIQEEDLQLEP